MRLYSTTKRIGSATNSDPMVGNRIHTLLWNQSPRSVPSRSPHGEEMHAGDVDGHLGYSDAAAYLRDTPMGSA